ncbi:MAG TPA: hypothetical protein PLX55_01335 [bacterium]|jgi:hypothetical protein|nr:hypothetical protein [bacterium]
MLLWDILLNKWFWLVAGALISFFSLGYSLKMARIFGKVGWAEKYFGPGGTYTMWKIIGVIAPIVAVVYFFAHK